MLVVLMNCSCKMKQRKGISPACILKWVICDSVYKFDSYQCFETCEWEFYCTESEKIKFLLRSSYPYNLLQDTCTPVVLTHPRDIESFERNQIVPSDSCLCYIVSSCILYEFCVSEKSIKFDECCTLMEFID